MREDHFGYVKRRCGPKTHAGETGREMAKLKDGLNDTFLR
jgi:hypothetical protein